MFRHRANTYKIKTAILAIFFYILFKFPKFTVNYLGIIFSVLRIKVSWYFVWHFIPIRRVFESVLNEIVPNPKNNVVYTFLYIVGNSLYISHFCYRSFYWFTDCNGRLFHLSDAFLHLNFGLSNHIT